MSKPDLAELMDQYHSSIGAVLKGDPEPQKVLFSRRDDVILANPLGPPVRGWDQVESALDRAASTLREGSYDFEIITAYAGTDLAYSVELERWRAKIASSDQMVSGSLRVTTVFRLEDGGWKVVHRHADPITSPRSIESLVDEKTTAPEGRT